jgi:tetratricopeptide (TPR) repeat protein
MSRKNLVIACLLIISASCSALGRKPALLFEGTGDHSFEVTTDEPQAQVYFDQGLALSYGFNHDEAVRSFEEAAHIDPECAMAYWGQAYALGPNMSRPVDEEHAVRASRAVERAMALRDGATELERGLIEALAVRLEKPVHEDREIIDAAYAGAMRALWRSYPDNADVGFLYADALVNETPWDLWSADFEPNYNTLEIIAVLDRVLELEIDHPGANHFYIHAWEPSGEAYRAEAAADRLLELTPGLGHMVHMPAHIYVQVGRYEDSVRCNDEGARLDREYFAKAGPQGIYHGYQAHNTHFRVWSAMYMGAYEEALEACQVLLDDLPDMMKEDPSTSQWTGMEQTVHLRFGNWEAALASPRPSDKQPYAVAIWHYGRGLAYANTKRFDAARTEAELLDEVAKTLPDDDMEFFETADRVMTIAREMLAGEIAYLSGDHELGYEHLRKWVEAEDALDYSEPSPWMVPTRHSLGALLLEQGRLAEAEELYRHDLKLHRGNIWSLHGLAEALERGGKTVEAAQVRAQFEEVSAKASVDVRSSCYCRTLDS